MSAHGASSYNAQARRLGHLPPALQLHIVSFLPPNDRALSGRLVSPDAAAGLSNDPTCTASLSQPLPLHAVPWAVEAGQQHVRQLPFRHKLRLLCTAAASGSEVNLKVAWALLQPSFFMERLRHSGWRRQRDDPGVAAVEAGHPQLLGWLLRRCPGLLDAQCVLEAAARHCDLAGLKLAWAVLKFGVSRDAGQRLLEVAAESTSSDAVSKMEWLLLQAGCKLGHGTAAAAAGSGDLGRLRWLRERGCPTNIHRVLRSAVQHAELAVAQWLVDEGGCQLPSAGSDDRTWGKLALSAAESPDGLEKVLWLQQKGAPRPGVTSWRDLLQVSLQAGHVELGRHALAVVGPEALNGMDVAGVVMSGSIAAVELLFSAGLVDSGTAYDAVVDAGDLGMLSWLVRVAKLPAAELGLSSVIAWWSINAPSDTAAHSRGLVQAVQLLVVEAGCNGWDAKEVFTAAAERGDLALVQYLLQQTPEYRPGWEVLVAAAEGGCEALLEWLVEQHPGCMQSPGSGVSPYASAAARGDLGTLNALRRLGVPWGAGDVVVQALRDGCSAPAMHWLAEHGAPVGSCEAMEAALASACASDRSIEMAAWLRSLAAAAAEAAAQAAAE